MFKRHSIFTLLMILITCGFSIQGVATAEEKPAALPADGGAPGKAYMEYCKAIVDGNKEMLKKLVSAERAQQMETPDFDEMFPMIQSMMAKDIKVTGGTMAAKEANLTAEGKDSMGGGVAKGEIHMVLEENQWKVEKDSWKSSMD